VQFNAKYIPFYQPTTAVLYIASPNTIDDDDDGDHHQENYVREVLLLLLSELAICFVLEIRFLATQPFAILHNKTVKRWIGVSSCVRQT
jgi:hypothetical protein